MKLENSFEQYIKFQHPIPQLEKMMKQTALVNETVLAPLQKLKANNQLHALSDIKSFTSITYLHKAVSAQNMLNAHIIKISKLCALQLSVDKISRLASIQKQAFQINTVVSHSFDRNNAIIEAFSNSVTASTPYVSRENLKCAEVEITNVEKKKHHLSLSDILALIGILLTLYTIIINTQPDDQLDRIIAQNDTIISQQEELLSQNQEDKGLQETLNTLRDSINLMADEAELLREEPESSNNLPDGNGLLNLNNGQKQNTNPKE